MSQLSDQVVTLSKRYLGPAAETFLAKQTKFHLDGLAFAALEKQHLPELAKWVYVSGSLIIEKDKAKELSDKIKGL